MAVAKLRGGALGGEWIEVGRSRPDATSRREIPAAMVPRDAYQLFVLGWNPAGEAVESQFFAVGESGDAGAEVWIDRVIVVPVGKIEEYKWRHDFGPLAFDRSGGRLFGMVTTRRLHQWRVPELGLPTVWDNTRVAESTGLGYLDALEVGSEWALAGGRDGIVRAVREERLEYRWPACLGPIESIRLSADESWAVVGTQRGGCGIARVPRGEWFAELPGHRGAVRAIALSADDQWLATGDEEGALRLWQRAGDSFSLWLTLPFLAPIRTIRITPDRSALVVLVEGETAVRVLDWAELEERLREMGLDAE